MLGLTELFHGRAIEVTQKRKLENGLLTRDAWITMNLPEFNAQLIIWHETLDPIILIYIKGAYKLLPYHRQRESVSNKVAHSQIA